VFLSTLNVVESASRLPMRMLQIGWPLRSTWFIGAPERRDFVGRSETFALAAVSDLHTCSRLVALETVKLSISRVRGFAPQEILFTFEDPGQGLPASPP